ncbi:MULTISPECIES: hypothetical protein [unclassified Microbacterium]|uniref:hypothetical protein n=1 Tax=unclassified Microbacterium TaxID=2609290 RepID=UPI0034667F02
MEVSFANDAGDVVDQLREHVYERLWDVLDQIMKDPDEAPHAPWSEHVSSLNLWGTKIPGTDYTVFWRIEDDDMLYVAVVTPDLGV